MEYNESADERTTLHNLAQEAFAAFAEAQQEVPEVVVDPAIPILFFGDLDAYRTSPLKIVTAALNPSKMEFPSDKPFERFPAAAGLRDVHTSKDFASYREALVSYFYPNQAPYRRWFSSLEQVLTGASASFYPGARNTALHTDVCSPVPTDPTWSNLATQRPVLLQGGRPLWHDLIRYLRPDVIVISVARSHVDQIDFAPGGPWSTLHTVERTNPYAVQQRRIHISDDHYSLLVFGAAMQTPFGGITDEDKRHVGESIERETIA